MGCSLWDPKESEMTRRLNRDSSDSTAGPVLGVQRQSLSIQRLRKEGCRP